MSSRRLPPMPSSRPPPLPKEEAKESSFSYSSTAAPTQETTKQKTFVRPASIKSFVRVDSNIYVVQSTSPVRSNRITELNIDSIINLTGKQIDYAVNFCSLREDDSPESLDRVVEAMGRLICKDGKVCLVQTGDLNLAGLVCMAHLMKNGGMTLEQTMERLKEKKFELKMGDKMKRQLELFRDIYCDYAKQKSTGKAFLAFLPKVERGFCFKLGGVLIILTFLLHFCLLYWQ